MQIWLRDRPRGCVVETLFLNTSKYTGIIYNKLSNYNFWPIPVSAWFKAWVYGFESRRGYGCLSLVNVVFSGRGPCDGLITRPDESYRVWCVWVWSWNLDNEEALVHWVAIAPWNKNYSSLQAISFHVFKCFFITPLTNYVVDTASW